MIDIVSRSHHDTPETDSQIPREVDVEAVLDSQVVTKELEGNDVQKTL